jgi:succinoglycan biosynthesis protein ExoH
MPSSIALPVGGSHAPQSSAIDRVYRKPSVSAIARIDELRLIFVIAVVGLHAAVAVPVGVSGSNWDTFALFLRDTVFRFAVPCLSLIAGYLFFRHSNHLPYFEMVKRKFFAYVVPFLIWNTPLALVLLFVLGNPKGYAWYDALFALTDTSAGAQMYFLRDLFVLALLSPIFGFLLRYGGFLGLTLIIAVGFANLDGFLVLRNDVAILFAMGGLAAIRQWDIFRLDAYALYAAIGAGLVVSLFVLIGWENRMPYAVAIAPLVWIGSARLPAFTKSWAWLSRYAGASFFIFLSHVPLLHLLRGALKLLGVSSSHFFVWTASTALLIVLQVQLWKWLSRRFPKFLRFAAK